MSTIDPAAALGTTGQTDGTGTQNARNTSGTLGKDDFLKLLVGQLQHQDPLQPTDSQQFISQMTQFSMLEQLTNLVSAQQQAASEAHSGQMLSLIGRTVTYLDTGDDGGDPTSRTGTVDGVSFVHGTPELTVDGVGGISPGTVTEVS